MKSSDWNSENLINGFIDNRVILRGLDRRTEKAYRIDLEQFYIWIQQRKETDPEINESGPEREVEGYLSYLIREKSLRPSTIYRKHKVLCYYLMYLRKQGVITGSGSEHIMLAKDELETEKPQSSILSKQEVDAFFQAMNREYEKMESDFRRRVCLRDLLMMKLLFYHGIEISQLIRLKVSDYDQKGGILTLCGKQGSIYSVHLFSKALRSQMEHWLEEHEYFERDGKYDRYLFLSKLGRPLSMKMIIEIFEKYRALAGIERECTPKDLKGSMQRYAREVVMEQCG